MTTLTYPTGLDGVARAGRAAPAPTLADRFYDLLALSTRHLDKAMERFVADEHELPEGDRHAAVRDRLGAWLELDDEDARILAGAFERATGSFPPEYRTRRIDTERAVIMNALTFDDFLRLVSILPWLREESAPLDGLTMSATIGR